MSKRSDRAAERKAIKLADKDKRDARTAARKAFDLRDPRFLGEAAVAATRGPVGLALFGASRGIEVLRQRRAEQAEILSGLAADARKHSDALREHTSALIEPPQKRSPLRRFAPLWIVGLAGGAAVAGATAYFLREHGASAPAPSTSPAPTAATPAPTPAPASETGEDLTIDSPDPDGPEGQADGTSPAAGSRAPGVAAGSAPQPSDDIPVIGTPTEKP